MADAVWNNRYVLQGEPDVKTDNTLSGDGTVDSPLGVANDIFMEESKLTISNNKITGYDTYQIGGSADSWEDKTTSISSVKSGIKMYYNAAIKMVCICGQYSHAQPSGNAAWVTCGTIASGYRPKANVGISACNTGTDFFDSKGYIDSNGVIRVMILQGNLTRNMTICCTYCL